MLTLAEKIGLAVARLREAHGYSQEAFADRCKVHRTFMGKLERGERDMQASTIEKLARGLKLKPSELLVEAEKEKEAKGGSGSLRE